MGAARARYKKAANAVRDFERNSVRVSNIGTHGVKVQAPKSLKGFIKEVLDLSFACVEFDVQVRNHRAHYSHLCFQIFREEFGSLVCYVRPPGDEPKICEIRVKDVTPRELEDRLIATTMPDREIPTVAWNELRRSGDVLSFWSNYLTDEVLSELSIMMFARSGITSGNYHSKQMGELFTPADGDRFFNVIWKYLRDQEGLKEDLNENEHEMGIIPIAWLKSCVWYLDRLDWFTMNVGNSLKMRGTRSPKIANRSAHALNVLPGSRAVFEIYKYWGIIPASAPYDPEKVKQTIIDHVEAFRFRSQAAHRLVGIDSELQSAERELQQIELQRERCINRINELKAESARISNDREIAPEIARDLLTERYALKLSA